MPLLCSSQKMLGLEVCLHTMAPACDALRKATHHIAGNLWLSLTNQVKEATWRSSVSSLVVTNSASTQQTCKAHLPLYFSPWSKTSPSQYELWKRMKGASALDFCLSSLEPNKMTPAVVPRAKSLPKCGLPENSKWPRLRLKLWTVMLWYCLVSSSVSHFAQLLSDKTGSRQSLFCMHSSSLKNIFIQLLR